MSSTLHLICISLVLVLTFFGGKARTALELVTLTMTERAVINRHAEWITIGVPVPKGEIRSTDELCVLQNGQVLIQMPTPMQISAMIRPRR